MKYSKSCLILLLILISTCVLTNSQKSGGRNNNVKGQNLRQVFNQLLESIDTLGFHELWPEISQLIHIFNAYIVDSGLETSVIEFFAILNIEPEVDNVLTFLTTHGFPELSHWSKSRMIASTINLLLSPTTRFKGKIDESQLIDLTRSLLERMVWFIDTEYFLEDMTELLEGNGLFQDFIVDILGSQNFLQAYARLRMNTMVKDILTIFGLIVGPEFVDMADQIQTVLGWDEALTMHKEARRSWEFNFQSISWTLIDIEDDDEIKLSIAYTGMIEKLHLDIEADGQYKNLIGSISPSLQALLTEGETWTDRDKFLQVLPKIPGQTARKPKTTLEDITDKKVHILDIYKSILDDLIRQGSAIPGEDQNNSNIPLTHYQKHLLKESKQLLREIKSFEGTSTPVDPSVVQKVKDIIIDIVMMDQEDDDDTVDEMGFSSTTSLGSQELSFREAFDRLMTHVDPQGLINLLNVGSSYDFFQKKTFPQKLGSILRDAYERPYLKEILIYLEQNGFPELHNTSELFQNFDPATTTYIDGDDPDLFQFIEKAILDLDKFFEDFFNLLKTNFEFSEFLKHIQSPEVILALEEFLDSNEDAEKLWETLSWTYDLTLLYAQKHSFSFEWNKFNQILNDIEDKAVMIQNSEEVGILVKRLVKIQWTTISKAFSEEKEFQKVLDYLLKNGLPRISTMFENFSKFLNLNLFPNGIEDTLNDDDDQFAMIVRMATKITTDLVQDYMLLLRDATKFFSSPSKTNVLTELLSSPKFQKAFRLFTNSTEVQKFFNELQDYGLDIRFLLNFFEKYLEWADCPPFVL